MTQTLIPAQTLERWRVNSRRRNLNKLDDLLELRAILCEAKAEGWRVIEQMQEEAAAAMSYSPETIRHLVADMREYSPQQLKHWISNGIAWEAIRTMNYLESRDLLNTTPSTLLDEAIDPGGAGGEVMTAVNLTAKALGHSPYKTRLYFYNLKVDSFTRALKLGEREQEFRSEIWQIFQKYNVETEAL